MKYTAVKNPAKDQVTFPCIRVGKDTGNLYLFRDASVHGIALGGGLSSFQHTDPWSGTVTITQD